ncbi:MAG: oxidoreductase-like domain-containing protein [Comamonas sp.]
MAQVESQPEALLQPLSQAQAQIALWTGRAAALQLSLRPPPPQPTSCCGRGCNGCVWEGFFDALQFWCEDAEQAVTEAAAAAMHA